MTAICQDWGKFILFRFILIFNINLHDNKVNISFCCLCAYIWFTEWVQVKETSVGFGSKMSKSCSDGQSQSLLIIGPDTYKVSADRLPWDQLIIGVHNFMGSKWKSCSYSFLYNDRLVHRSDSPEINGIHPCANISSVHPDKLKLHTL